MCSLFTGLFTPEEDLVRACLQSYAEPLTMPTGTWRLRSEDAPSVRRREIEQMSELLKLLGNKLGFSVGLPGTNLVTWKESGIVFSVIASALIGRAVANSGAPAEQTVVVLPGSRSSLVQHKIDTNPDLQRYKSEGLRFLKYRHLRRLYESHTLTQANMLEQLTLDPPGNVDPRPQLL
jgi:hypothetical protein